MDLPGTADVVVVGAGIAGASAGWALAERGLQVVVLEAEPAAGHHATGRSAALLTETYGAPEVSALVRASRPFLVDPPDGFADVSLTAPRGVLWIADDEGADALHAEAAGWAAEHEVLDAEGARRIVPLVRDQAAVVAVHEPGALDLDVDALLQGYLRVLRARGGTVATGTPVTAVEPAGGGWVVRAPTGEVSTPVVVDAAGAWADAVAALAGVEPLGLQPLRRTAFLFRPPEGHDTRRWPLVCDAAEAFYVKPDAGMLLGSPADTTPSEPCDARPEEIDVALGIEAIEAALDLEVVGVRAPWAGLRTFTPDHVPTVGRDPAHPGFVWLAGQGGYGIKTSPAMAWATASVVLGEPWPEALTVAGIAAAALDPARFRTGAVG
jgi:D-arginine dehydrogenase